MRLVLIAVLALGCREHDGRGGGDDDDLIDGGGGPRPDAPRTQVGLGGRCELDADCAQGVCAHGTDVCTEPMWVRNVKTTWTVNGQPADAVTCAGLPTLGIAFDGGPRPLSFAPVPCELGQYVITHLPLSYTLVKLGPANGAQPSQVIPASNQVAFDL